MENDYKMFQHGMSILIEPKNFDFDNLGLEGEKVDREKYKEFFSGNFERYKIKTDFINEKFGNVNFMEFSNGENFDKVIEIDDSKGPVNFILILAGENCNGKVIINKTGNGNYVGEDIRVIAKEGSKVEIVCVQNLGSETNNFQKRQAICHKDSTVNWTDLVFGSAYTRSEAISFLEGKGASSKNKVLFVGKGEQQFDLYTCAVHIGEETCSDLVTRGILKDKSKVLSRGLIKIEEGAFNAQGYEKQDALILDRGCEADAIPNLEIHNNEVKCSHGSTIGKLDEEKLFYLMSRGLNEKEAKYKIVEGYFNPVIETLGEDVNKKIVEDIKKHMDEVLG